ARHTGGSRRRAGAGSSVPAGRARPADHVRPESTTRLLLGTTRGILSAVTIETGVRERVGRLLTEYLDGAVGVDPTERPVAIRAGTAMVQVRLIDADPPVVRVFSSLLRGVECSAELLAELNEINAHLSFARLFWRDGAVLGATELLAATIDPNELAN